ncbi:7d2653e6-f87c-4a37-828a-28422310e823 [Thermothielavioides terrestris]
MVIES